MRQHIATLGGVTQELIGLWNINLYFKEERAPNGFPCYFSPTVQQLSKLQIATRGHERDKLRNLNFCTFRVTSNSEDICQHINALS